MTSANQLFARSNRRMYNSLVNAFGAPIVGLVTAVNSEAETMDVVHHGGRNDRIKILHPYISNDHWHRVGGGVGQKVSMQVRPSTKNLEAIAYYQTDGTNDNIAATRIARYRAGKDTYRPLASGEQELVSRGLAQTFMGRRPVMDQRAGYVRNWLDQDRLEAGQRAVLHTRQLHLNGPKDLGDEERFGAVQRPDSAAQQAGGFSVSTVAGAATGGGKSAYRVKFIDAPAGLNAIPNPPQNISAATDVASVVASVTSASSDPAKEYVRILKTASGSIVDFREGHVMDLDGSPLTSKFSKNLRVQWRVYGTINGPQGQSQLGGLTSVAGTGSSNWEMQVDEDGNYYVGLPQTATEGYRVEIPAGKYEIKSGQASASLTLDGIQNLMKLASGQSGEISALQNLKVRSQSVKLGQTDAAIHKAYLTQIKKGGEIGLHGGLIGGQSMESAVNLATVAARSLLTAVHGAVSAVPLTPGVLVGLMGIANNIIAVVLHTAVPTIKILKGGLSGTYAGAYDTYQSQNVEVS